MGGSADSTIPATQVITYTVPTGGLPDCVNDGLGLVRSADGFKGSILFIKILKELLY